MKILMMEDFSCNVKGKDGINGGIEGKFTESEMEW